MLGHAALGLLGLLAGFHPGSARVVLRALAIGGAALALVTLADASGLDAWRTLEPTEPVVAIVAVGALVAWIVTAARPLREVLALVGVAISGLFLFATGAWIAPALAFWLCSSIALAATHRDGAWWISLALSDLALVAATVPEAVTNAAWAFPDAPGSWQHWAIAAAVVVRSGAVLHVGAWRLTGSYAAPVVPLAVTSAMVIAARLGGPPAPWLSATLLMGGFGLALFVLLRGSSIVAIGTWVSAVFASLVIAHPVAALASAWAGVVVAGVVSLWPFARGRGAMSRAAALALVPPSPAFAAIALVAAAAFVRSTGGAGTDRFAWAAVAALLPLVLASAVAVAARAAQTARSDDFEPAPVIATWALVVATLTAGIFGSYLPGPSVGERGDTALFAVAAVVGGFGALRARGLRPAATQPPPTIGVVSLGRTPTALVTVVSALGGAVAIAGVVWLLVEGLRVGFL